LGSALPVMTALKNPFFKTRIFKNHSLSKQE
jgi:hypothetical protein